MKKDIIFRDSKNLYTRAPVQPSRGIINFTIRHAGKRILDVGCATGAYCRRLNELGYECTGADINPEYVAKAIENDIEAYCFDAECLEFPEYSFDTVLLFEILEHARNPGSILKEAKRVARNNILITVPNCTGFFKLKKLGLTYEHMLETDHINFFTKMDLEDLLSRYFKVFKVQEKEPISLGGVGLPWLVPKLFLLLCKMKLIRTEIYYRLYALAEV